MLNVVTVPPLRISRVDVLGHAYGRRGRQILGSEYIIAVLELFIENSTKFNRVKIFIFS